MLGVADVLADESFAVVAIDLPLHGVTDSTDPFFQPGKERTFDLAANPVRTTGSLHSGQDAGPAVTPICRHGSTASIFSIGQGAVNPKCKRH